MRRPLVSVASVLAVVSIMVVGCGQAASPPSAPTAAPTKAAAAAAPTSAPAAPTKAAAPAAQPTTAPAAKTAFPEKGKSINVIIPMAAGGGTDIAARSVATAMEKDLGVPIQIVNKAGASGQLGLTDIANGKPDGYNLGVVNLPTGLITYLDKSRGASYDRQSFMTIGLISADPIGINVKADSPFKTAKELVDAAKAKPGELKASTTGIGSVTHLAGLALEREAGIKLSYVHFDSTPLSLTAMMGGHVNMMISGISGLWSQYKNKEALQIGVFDRKPNVLTPDVPTFESQGFKVYAESNYGFITPKGTPPEVVARLEQAFLKAIAEDSVKQKLLDLGQSPRGYNAAEYEKSWNEMEQWTAALMPNIK